MKNFLLLVILAVATLTGFSQETLRTSNTSSIEVENFGKKLAFITQVKLDSLTCDSLEKKCFVHRSFVNEADVIPNPDASIENSFYLAAYKQPGIPYAYEYLYRTQENKKAPWLMYERTKHANTVTYDQNSKTLVIAKDVPYSKTFFPAFGVSGQLVCIIILLIIFVFARYEPERIKGIYNSIVTFSTILIIGVLIFYIIGRSTFFTVQSYVTESVPKSLLGMTLVSISVLVSIGNMLIRYRFILGKIAIIHKGKPRIIMMLFIQIACFVICIAGFTEDLKVLIVIPIYASAFGLALYGIKSLFSIKSQRAKVV
ncbi:hypothetical protein IPF86_00920 [Candidatus Nomurabacteria bacterium]|jgi:hypothetical protein|nr:MAG: hypothetical protein IPF86_00920 [Candidatus Nomurabacteria bacterium]